MVLPIDLTDAKTIQTVLDGNAKCTAIETPSGHFPH